jgi:hypothetical protein
MHTTEEQAWGSNDLLEEVTVANVADLRAVRRQCAITITIRHPDIPAGVSFGTFYLEGSLRRLFKALEEAIPEFVGSLETRVSEERSGAFSPTDLWGPLFSAPVGSEGVVPDSSEQR